MTNPTLYEIHAEFEKKQLTSQGNDLIKEIKRDLELMAPEMLGIGGTLVLKTLVNLHERLTALEQKETAGGDRR